MCGVLCGPDGCNDKSVFNVLMARADDNLPAATWTQPGDLSRMSIEAMERRIQTRS